MKLSRILHKQTKVDPAHIKKNQYMEGKVIGMYLSSQDIFSN